MKNMKKLSDSAKTKWRELVKIYELNEYTKDIIYALCQCYGRFIDAEEHMNDKGMLYKNPSGKVEASPMIGISNKMQTQIKKHYDSLSDYKISYSNPVVWDNLDLGDIDFG